MVETEKLPVEKQEPVTDPKELESFRKWTIEYRARTLQRPHRTEKGRIRATVRILGRDDIAPQGTTAEVKYVRGKWEIAELHLYTPKVEKKSNG